MASPSKFTDIVTLICKEDARYAPAAYTFLRAGLDHTVRALMKQMSQMSMWQRLKMVTGMGKAGAFLPGGMDNMKLKGDTGHRKSAKERAEERKKNKKKRR